MADVGNYRQRAAETKRLRTREALLEGARQMLGERSWHETRFEDIARCAGVSPATAYQYFKNKRAIIGPALLPYYEDLREKLETDIKKTSPLQAFEGLVHRLADFVRKRQILTINLLTATREQAVLGEARPAEEQDILEFVPFSSLMIDCLELAQSKGEIPADLAIRQIGSYHANALFLRVFIDPFESAEDTADLVLSQIKPVLQEATRSVGSAASASDN